jgi:hypothetical protein
MIDENEGNMKGGGTTTRNMKGVFVAHSDERMGGREAGEKNTIIGCHVTGCAWVYDPTAVQLMV